MRLSKDEIVQVVQYELQQALGHDSDVLATKREQALNYYNGLSPAPPTEVNEDGEVVQVRSGIVSMDVADCLHSLMAQVQPVVKTTTVEFEPENEQDEPTAQAESDFTRKIIEQQGGFKAMFSACHDAFLFGNGWIKIENNEVTERVEYKYPKDLPDEALSVLANPIDPDEEVEIEEDDEALHVFSTTTEKQLTFKAIPPEQMVFSNDTGLDSFEDLRLVGQIIYLSVSQLLEIDGLSREVIEAMPDATSGTDMAISARQGIYQNQVNFDTAQDATRLKKCYDCWILLDDNDNGTTERRNIMISGNTIITDEPASHVPFISGSAVPMPHRVEGTGLYELLGSIQSGKTHILRQYMDNLEAANLGRTGVVEGQVNMNDLTNGRINGIVRCKSPDSVFPLNAAQIGDVALPGLNYLDEVRTQRVGAALDFNDVQSQLMGTSATAAAGQLAKIEQMSGWFCSNLVETLLKPAFKLTHRLIREDGAGQMQMKLRGKWVDTDTNNWANRKNIAITMGLTTTERAAQQLAMSSILQAQTALIQQGAGDVLTDFPKMYNAYCDWVRANGLQDPEQYFTDPTSQEAQQAQQQKMQTQQQNVQMQAQQQQQMVQMQHRFELQKQENDLKFKYYDARLDAETKEADITTTALTEQDKINAETQRTEVARQDEIRKERKARITEDN